MHIIQIPAGQTFIVTPALSSQVDSLAEFARKHQAIAVINGGFFDPENQQSTSRVMLQGQLVADPQQNPRLMSNPALQPYLPQILNRTELRRYRCGSIGQYDLARSQDPIPPTCTRIEALGAGPRLLPNLTLEAEGFLARDAEGRVIRDPLGYNQPNARSAIGLKQDGSVLFVIVAQKPGIAASGMTLPELATLMKRLGAQQALNLDGGSSTSLYYRGRTIYGKLDDSGQPIQRSVKSVLLVRPATSQ